MELVDIINENDEVIGQATREDADNDPKLMHRTVHFTLVDRKDNTVLMTQRSFSKKNDAGKYCFLGEHLIAGEDYEEGVIRGIKEELGINVLEAVQLDQNIFKYDSQTELVKFYVSSSGDRLTFDKREIEQVHWVNFEDMKDSNLDISDMTKYWIENIDWKLVF